MQQVRRDTVKIARHNKVNIDTMSWEVAYADTTFVQANKESYEAVMSGKKVQIMCDVKDTFNYFNHKLLNYNLL